MNNLNFNIEIIDDQINYSGTIPMVYYNKILSLTEVQDVGLEFLKSIEREKNRALLDTGQE